MVLLVLGVPILVLLLALALELLETTLLPTREVDLPDGEDSACRELRTGLTRSPRPSPDPGDVRYVISPLASPRGTSSRPPG